MKKIIALFSSILLLISDIPIFAESDIVVRVNDRELDVDQPPIMYQDRVLVPMRSICEALKCNVTWDENTQTAQIENPVTIMAVKIGSGYITKIDRENQENVQTIPIDVPAMIINDRTMLPARAIAEALHAVVEWNDVENMVGITMEYDFIEDFYEGIAVVYKNGKYGYINEQREVVIPLKYDSIQGFVNGFAVVLNDKYGYVDRTGKEITPLKYNRACDFSNSFAIVELDRLGYIDQTGKEITPLKYNIACDFVNGFAVVGLVEGLHDKFGYIDQTGKEITPLKYDSASDFAEGFAVVELDGKFGYIDRTGKEIIPLKYDKASAFSDGFADVEIDGISGYIDTTGKFFQEE